MVSLYILTVVDGSSVYQLILSHDVETKEADVCLDVPDKDSAAMLKACYHCQ